jgi:hypothetical protein
VITLDPLNAIFSQIEGEITTLQALIEGLRERSDDAAGWPVGTAQVVGVLRMLLLQVTSGAEAATALDWAVADQIVPQMGQLDEAQLTRAGELFDDAQLPNARQALQHLRDPHAL